MPERQDDNNGLWKYPTVYPGANMKLNVNAVTLQDGLVEAVGVDGRFLGAIRPFPGMADQTIHGVPKPSASTTITSLTNIVFAKYVAIQKGLSNDLLKGIMYIADNPGGTGKAVYFAYWDTATATADVRLLENLDAWTDFKLTSYTDYDFASLGRYAYACFVGDTTSTVASFQNTKPPYNKAYFWDWKINSWDKFVTGFDDRFMSILPARLLSVNLNATGPGALNGNDVMDTAVIAGDGAGNGPLASDVYYTFSVQLVSKKHGLRSYLRWNTQKTLTTLSDHSLRYTLSGLKPPVDYAAFIQQIRGNSTERTHILEWGIPHYDGFKLWRSPQDDLALTVDEYSFTNQHLNDHYKEDGEYSAGSAIKSQNINYRTVTPSAIMPTIYSERNGGGDGAVVQQQLFDASLDEFGACPRLKRLVAYDGLLVGVVDADEPSAFNIDTQENEQSPEAIVWSTLTAQEPENFPVANYYRLDNPAERFLQLVTAGDHLFGITNASIYKITRGGGSLGVNKLTSALGGVSRYGAAGVGGSLFVVTPSGVKEADGNSGETRSLSIMDRIILDDSEWAGTLANVFVEYDAKIGALIFLNTSKKEAYILWEATGAVTKLIEIPWTFLTAGPDALTDGPQRAYFITSTGTVHVIDGAREMGKRSLCGTTLTETVNGTCTTASATAIIDATATFPANCVGFRVYMLSGARIGESLTITARASATNLTVTGLSGTTAVGDRYSVSPVVTRITLPQLVGQGGDIDPFVRKIVTAMMVAFSDLGGEYTGVNGKVTMGLKQNLTTIGSTEVPLDLVPDQVVGRLNLASTRALPFLEFKGGNLDFEMQAVLVKGILGISEFQSRTGT